ADGPERLYRRPARAPTIRVMLRALMAFLLLPIPSSAQVRVIVSAAAPGTSSAAAGSRAPTISLSLPSASSLSVLEPSAFIVGRGFAAAVPFAAAQAAPSAQFAAPALLL